MSSKNIKLFLYLTASFTVTFVTLVTSHEAAHFVMSKWLGYDPILHYGPTYFGFPYHVAFNQQRIYDVPIEHNILALASGPAFTDLIGSIGIALLFFFRKPSHRSENLSPAEWVFITMASFWLRHVLNFIIWTCHLLLSIPIRRPVDEFFTANLLGWPSQSIVISSAIISGCVFLILLIKFIPKQQRQPFFYAMLTGGFVAYLLWYRWLGPIVLP